MPPVLEVWSLNHWTAREVPSIRLLNPGIFSPYHTHFADGENQGREILLHLQTRGTNSAFTVLLLPSPHSPPRHVPGGLRHRLSSPAAAGTELLRASGLPVREAAPACLRTLSGQTAEHQAEGPGGPATALADAQPGEARGDRGRWPAACVPTSPSPA